MKILSEDIQCLDRDAKRATPEDETSVLQPSPTTPLNNNLIVRIGCSFGQNFVVI
jgi:hypothetical protein